MSAEDCLNFVAREAKTIRDIKNEYLLLVNLDIQNAYPTASHQTILKNLNEALNIPSTSRLYGYIKEFLLENKVQVNCNGFLSTERTFTAGVGVPQGAVLSPLLFRISLIGIEKCIKGPASAHSKIIMYADDMIVLVRHQDLNTAIKYMESACAQLVEWLYSKNYQIARNKIVFMQLIKPRQWWKHMQTREYDSDSSSVGLVQSANTLSDSDSVPKITIKFSYAENVTLRSSKSHRILGVILNEGMSFQPYIESIKVHTQTWINLLKTLCGSKYLAQQQTVIAIYEKAIRPRIEYGSVAYNMMATKTELKKLDIIQNNCMRIDVGAFRTTPIEHLENETGIVPLEVRRQYKTLRQATKIYAMRTRHPAYMRERQNFHNVMQHLRQRNCQLPTRDIPIEDDLLQRFRMEKKHIESIGPWYAESHSDSASISAPWTMAPLKIDLSFEDCAPSSPSTAAECNAIFREFASENYQRHRHIFTDASLIPPSSISDSDSDANSESIPSVSYAVYDAHTKTPLEAAKIVENKYVSVFTAEMYAILRAFHNISNNPELQPYVVIFTDSLSSCRLLQNPKTFLQLASHIAGHDTIVKKIFALNHDLATRPNPTNVSIVWIPSHVGIAGNEAADMLAKSMHNIPSNSDSNCPITFGDLTTYMKQQQQVLTINRWQHHSNERASQSILCRYKGGNHKRLLTFDCFPRQSQQILSRLRMEHSRLTHEHLFNRGDANPESGHCPKCNEPQVTVVHILNNCVATQSLRAKLKVSTASLFGTVADAKAVLQFLNETQLIKLI